MWKRLSGVLMVWGVVMVTTSCAPKKELVPPVSQAQLSAENAIKSAEETIEDARSIGVPPSGMSEAETLLAKAKEALARGDFSDARKLADQARESAERDREIFLAEKAAREETAREEAAKKAAAEERKFYTVGTWERDRDCLWNISKKEEIYNDPWKWKKIYKANRDKIEDPDLIYPRQKLTIP